MKKQIFSILLSLILCISYLQFSTLKNTKRELNLQQIGAVCAYEAFASESNNVTYGSASGILLTVGYGMVKYGVPNTWNPTGWYALATGALL